MTVHRIGNWGDRIVLSKVKTTNRHLVVFAMVVCVVVGTLAFSTASAFASYYPGVAFDVEQSAGGLQPVGLAVDDSLSLSSGDVYVSGGTVVNVYGGEHALAGSSTPDRQLTGFNYAYGVAVDPANGDVYVADDYGVVHKFGPEGTGLAFSLEIPVGAKLSGEPGVSGPGGIAVNPSNGHVYVADLTADVVYEFTSTGVFTGNTYAGPEGAAAQGVAVNSTGDVYVADGSLIEFTAPGSVFQTVQEGGGVNGVTINQVDNVFISQSNSIQKYSPTGEPNGSAFGSLATAFGIGIDNTTGTVYAADNPANDAQALVEIIVVASSEIETGEAVSITPTSAVIPGKLNPGGESKYYVEYGTEPCSEITETCGEKTGEVSTIGNTSQETGPFELTGLKQGTTYHYWLVAANSVSTVHGAAKEFTTVAQHTLTVSNTGTGTGTITSSPAGIHCGITCSFVFDEGTTVTLTAIPAGGSIFAGWTGSGCSGTSTCETTITSDTTATAQYIQSPPRTTTVGAWNITPGGAGVVGEVNPQGTTLQECEFEYGLTNTYGSVTDCASSPGTGTTPVPVSTSLTNLAPNATYHYRLKTKNAGGTTTGTDQQFLTAQNETELEQQETTATTPTPTAEDTTTQKQYEELAALTSINQQDKTQPETTATNNTTIKILHTKSTPGHITIILATSASGTVTITGPGLKNTTQQITRGTHTITIQLTRTGKTYQQHHKKTKITATLKAPQQTTTTTKTAKL